VRLIAASEPSTPWCSVAYVRRFVHRNWVPALAPVTRFETSGREAPHGELRQPAHPLPTAPERSGQRLPAEPLDDLPDATTVLSLTPRPRQREPRRTSPQRWTAPAGGRESPGTAAAIARPATDAARCDGREPPLVAGGGSVSGVGGPSSRVGYLTDHYPATSNTFVQREVAALRDLGVDVHTFSTHQIGPEHVLSKDDRAAFGAPSPSFRSRQCASRGRICAH
jgi:hypothetical protein